MSKQTEALKRIARDDTEHGVEYYRADEADALLAEQPAQQELLAWQTVPTDPSIASCITGSMAVGGAIDGKQAALVYAAMLNAAPQPAQQEPARPVDRVDDLARLGKAAQRHT